ncbi:proline-rich protein HaeIII subfamily 1-like [Rousettus aegyptiacus]|uniref:proline-rich protein HaeIII subfamily 1-like n=1 Tax=Rousettus aegyptiacus TaxID=9407 RepID=UPI00168CBDA6|nr:proline-rich protein HaeIII subfamily 1-like [Rousettus aegyptiacus]
MTRPAPRAPSAGRTLGQQQGTWPAARSRLRPPGAPRRRRLGAGGGWSRRHRERAGPGQPHTAAVLPFVAPSSGWPPPFPRESWREGRSSRHAGGGFCGLREGSPPGWAPDPATIGPLAPPQAAWPDPGCGGDKGDIVPMSLSSAFWAPAPPPPPPLGPTEDFPRGGGLEPTQAATRLPRQRVALVPLEKPPKMRRGASLPGPPRGPSAGGTRPGRPCLCLSSCLQLIKSEPPLLGPPTPAHNAANAEATPPTPARPRVPLASRGPVPAWGRAHVAQRLLRLSGPQSPLLR